MAIIVEDGSIVANANSFVSTNDYIDYALSLGIDVTVDIDAEEANLVKATQYIASHEANLKGILVDRDQTTPYPRTDLIIEGWGWGFDEIPRQAILAQMNIAIDYHNGIDPYNPEVNRVVTEETVSGAVSVKYKGGMPSKASKQTTSNALMSLLLKNSGLFSVPSVRR